LCSTSPNASQYPKLRCVPATFLSGDMSRELRLTSCPVPQPFVRGCTPLQRSAFITKKLQHTNRPFVDVEQAGKKVAGPEVCSKVANIEAGITMIVPADTRGARIHTCTGLSGRYIQTVAQFLQRSEVRFVADFRVKSLT
jgi:hypothetical protein